MRSRDRLETGKSDLQLNAQAARANNFSPILRKIER